MPIEDQPIPSQWYRHLDKGHRFQVVAVDETAGTVEIQHFDGDVEELDLDDWYALEIEPIEPPEDWTGPMDDIERDDLPYTETDMSEKEWTEPLEEHPAEAETEEEEQEDQEKE
jgi:hypothetical protein